VIGLAVGLYCSFAFNIIDVLQAPVLPYLKGNRLVIIHPMDAFSIRIQIAFVIGLAIAAPVLGYQVWAFLAPALHKPEKRVIIPVLFGAALMFLVGVSVAWFFVLPMSLKWLYGLVGDSLTPMYAASAYFSFATNLALAFGFAFEVPILLVALTALGILTANALNKARKFAILAIFVGAAIISPGDAIIATIALAVPLYLLYELSVVFAFVLERRRRAKQEREAREELAAS